MIVSKQIRKKNQNIYVKLQTKISIGKMRNGTDSHRNKCYKSQTKETFLQYAGKSQKEIIVPSL